MGYTTAPSPVEIAANPALQAKLFRGFGDTSRLSILQTLRFGEQPVGAIVQATGLSQPNVSAHLACLRDCGLVVGRQEGRSVYYSLADERIEDLFLLAQDILARIGGPIGGCPRYEK
ncbi:MAG: helix-turn-helix transcriptional regulator [Armatimonadetes bacterium]|nr:helix-turn-helix transcriptional regulator [Armatimonadota bacterium]